ncbi:MAG: deoxyribonuclease IV [Candidatus Liptonbacteria bacterium]|nr:deoxyribonuclease IV [Candidatus Liptonbacteria bacterium]
MSLPAIGAHVSAAGRLSLAIDRARNIGAECIQLFGASPQQWTARMPREADTEDFKKRRAESGIGPAYLHAAYLVNLASPDQALRERSERSLADHLKIAEMLGAEGLIFHVGSGKELPKEEAVRYVVGAMQRVLEAAPGAAELVIENSAGGGQKIGSSLEEIAHVIRHVGSPRVKTCFDTAHAFEAGLIERYDREGVARLIGRLDATVGLRALVALHVNDSKTAFNSHHDRHENIGEGQIGLDGFRELAKRTELHDKAWILEVPGFENAGPDRRNIELLKSCFS